MHLCKNRLKGKHPLLKVNIVPLDFSIGTDYRALIITGPNERAGLAIVYKPVDSFNNIIILYKDEFLEANERRVKLELKAEDLYPEDYDFNILFVNYEKRKLERDIERGSKKALKRIQREIRSSK